MGDDKIAMKNYENLNILFITQEDPFYVQLFFEEFLKNFRDPSRIKGVIICSTLGKNSLLQLAKQMLNFYGIFGFMLMSSKYIGKRIMTLISRFNSFNKCYSLK